MFQNGQKVVVLTSGDPTRVIKVQDATGDTARYPTVTADGVTGRDQQVQVVTGGDPDRIPKLKGIAREAADALIRSLSPAAWYRNATGITITGSGVAVWADQSGNGRDLLQGTDSARPAYSGGILTFNGTSHFMEAVYTAASPRTRYIVFSQVSWASNDYILDGATANTAVFAQTNAGASPQIRIQIGVDASASSTAMAIGAYGIAACVWSGASSSLTVNNESALTANITTTPTTGGIMVGTNGAGSGSFSNIGVKEVIDFAAAHDAATRTSVINALNRALTVF